MPKEVEPLQNFFGIFRVIVSSLAALLVSILFIVVYVALSELHRELAVDVHAALRVSSELITADLVESVFWMLDGTVAGICLFLILERSLLCLVVSGELVHQNLDEDVTYKGYQLGLISVWCFSMRGAEPCGFTSILFNNFLSRARCCFFCSACFTKRRGNSEKKRGQKTRRVRRHRKQKSKL
ncbi:hypothetical protein Y032_0710g1731 [Ancylostoma ceylanicum]|uniref:Uncharacterized protein n=1 Tax=Ancylostoma ceylanicum TaxID=53326 RepID=A0A016WHV5_9BILA|nr:hypothetical protein Y032_0710g1731 [Ancylostoma ceylanicum]